MFSFYFRNSSFSCRALMFGGRESSHTTNVRFA